MDGQAGSTVDGSRHFFSFLSLSVVRVRREETSFGGAGVDKGVQEAAGPVDSCQSPVWLR